jgi:hypothetical protein
VVQLSTIQQWLQEIGWGHELQDANTLRIVCPDLENLPFYARCTEHWLLLAIVPALPCDASRPPDLARRLLAVNRDMRLAKYAYDEDGDVALTAELPTESLDASELRDAVERMARYAEHYKSYLCAG